MFKVEKKFDSGNREYVWLIVDPEGQAVDHHWHEQSTIDECACLNALQIISNSLFGHRVA